MEPGESCNRLLRVTLTLFQKDTDDLVSCDDCGRWQHVNCHDRQDMAAGKGIRDWDKVDFRVRTECTR